MANIKSSKKDIRRTEKRRLLNAQQKARLRTFDKKVRSLISEGKADEAKEAFRLFSSYVDRAGKRNLIHHRQADRRKARLARLVQGGAAQAS
ncbi:MAG: 30S ribosomal protein S20 [Leptospiraceae bacterium]|nr:30S ribosomal protein S20 [Leptospiraceae bacterium]MCB1302947.1 30S ribosomal protein S20 [Leptospiraceae bacterium]